MSSDSSWQHRDADPDAAFWSGEADRRADSGADYNGYGYYGQTAPSPAPQPATPYEPTPYAQPTVPKEPVQDRWQPSAHGPQPYSAQPYEVQPFNPLAQSSMVPYMYPRPEHPNATSSLVLGILGLFVPILSPIGLAMAMRGRKDIREHPGVYNEANNLTAGLVLGGIGTALFALYVLFYVFIIVVAVFMA